MPTLTVLYGPDHGHSFTAEDESLVIGRAAADLQLSDSGCSRQHARLQIHQGNWCVEDLHSANGTYLNGQGIHTTTRLHHGDQIRIGSSLILYHDQSCWDGRSGSSAINNAVDINLNHPLDASIISSLNAVTENTDQCEMQQDQSAAAPSWSVICHLANIFATSHSTEALLNRMADILMDKLEASRLIVLRLCSRDGNLIPEVARFRREINNQRPCIEVSEKITNHVLEKRDGVLCHDAITDERFTADSNNDSIHRLGLRSVICVPIITRNQVFGLVHADSSKVGNAFTEDQLRLAVAMGWVTGIAIDNIELHQTRLRTERLAATGETVAYLSHHMRNLLQGMQSGADFVESGLERSELDRVRSGWQLIRRNIDRTLNFASNMLTFSKERQPLMREVNINLIVQEVLSLTQRLCEEEHICVETSLGSLPAIASDADGVHQVIHNIVLNAIQALKGTQGVIQVSTKHDMDTDQIVITVVDNGPGISKRHMEHLFDAFHSGKGQAGTGLGLAASKKIVEELNGTIRAETYEDRGTHLVVSIPATATTSFDIDQTPQPD